MIEIIFLFFGILSIIYLIIITEPLHENKKNIIPVSNINIRPIDIKSIYIQPIDIQHTNLNKKRILWKNNKKRKQKRKT